MEVHDGKGAVLAFVFGFDASGFCAKGFADCSVELGGHGFVCLASVVCLCAVGFAVGGVAVEGDHDGAVVVAGNAGALAYGCGIKGIDAGADYGDFFIAEDLADGVGVFHDNLGLVGGAIGGDCSGVEASSAAVAHAVAGVEDDDWLHGES